MAKVKKNGAAHTSRSQLPYHLMLAPGMLFLLLFHIVPMGGLIMAFQNYVPIKGLLGSDFVGLKNFQRLFRLPTFWNVLKNTVVISVFKLVLVTLAAIVLMTTLNMGKILSGGFDQVFNLYSPLVYQTGDIIDTYVYRMGLVDLQYSNGTAVGLFKSLISFVLLVVSYKLSDKFVGYRVF